jgi:hypothetical protein
MKDRHQILAGLLHTLLCVKNHELEPTAVLDGRREGTCYFYIEETLENTHEYPDHIFFEKLAYDYCSQMKMEPLDVIGKIKELTNHAAAINELLSQYEMLKPIFYSQASVFSQVSSALASAPSLSDCRQLESPSSRQDPRDNA